MISFIIYNGVGIHISALYIATLIIFVLTSFIVYEYFSKKKINKPVLKAIIMLICLHIIFNRIGADAYETFVYIGLLCSIILICSLISDCFSHKKNRKDIACKTAVLLVYLLVMVLNIPFYFFIKALDKGISTVKAEKYYLLAKDTAIIPPVKLYMYYELISFYGSDSYKGKNRGRKIIEIYEKNTKLSKDLLIYFPKYYICQAYFWKPDRENLIKYCGTDTTFLAIDFMRTKEYNKALETINLNIKKYESKHPRKKIPCTLYGIRANIYKQIGNNYKYYEDSDKINPNNCPHNFETARNYAQADDISDMYQYWIKKDWENSY